MTLRRAKTLEALQSMALALALMRWSKMMHLASEAEAEEES